MVGYNLVAKEMYKICYLLRYVDVNCLFNFFQTLVLFHIGIRVLLASYVNVC
jgi:hypothetical protein